jgi:hypothetical protein
MKIITKAEQRNVSRNKSKIAAQQLKLRIVSHACSNTFVTCRAFVID